MTSAIGMIEFKTIASGITATDQAVKTANIKLIEAQAVCPGKYISLFSGDLSAVKAAVERAKAVRPEEFIDSFVLGNPDDAIFPAIYGSAQVENVSALGILETYDASAIIVAADVAAKTAIVKLIEIRIAKGLCGKSYMLITGEVAACEAAIEKAKAQVAQDGMFLDSSVIANPDSQLWENIL